MSYDQQTWADDEAGDTPITAAKLNHIEQGIEDAAVVADQATTALASKADVSYVDAIGSVDSIAGVMRRDGSGNTVANAVFLNAPVEAANQAARKDYVDAIGTTAATANTVVRRNEFSGSDFVYLNVTTPPANGQHAANKDYVDGIGKPGWDGDLANNVVRRDPDGQSWFARAYATSHPPVSNDEVTRKDYVDAIGTSEVAPSTIARRDANGWLKAARMFIENDPAFPDELTRKSYVDAIGTPNATPSTVMRRNIFGEAFASVFHMSDSTNADADRATRKDYVDAAIAAAVAGLSSGGTTTYPSLGKMRAGLAARNTFPFRIVFAGSSTTAGSNATTTANRYVNRLVAMMQSAYPALSGSETAVVNSTTATLGTLSSAGGVHGYNVGESSTTSATYLDATERTNVGNANPRVIVHMIGANDYGNNLAPATFKTNVLTVVNDLKSKTAGPCVQILVHTYARPDVTAPTYAWSLYGAQLKQIADADPDNVAFIDISEVYRVSDISGTDPLNLIDTDLLHQTDQGHALMADLIWQGFGMQPLAASAAASTGSGSVIAADNFDRANSTTLGSTTTGAKPWATMGTVTAQIVSNTMGVSAATSITGVYVDPAITNYTVQAKLAALTAGAGNQQGGLLFRGVDANNFWWLSTRKDATTVGYDIYKNVAGVTTRVTTTATGTPTVGQTVKVVCSGTTYTAYVDGTQIAQVTGDTALSTGTRAGFCFGASGLGTRWDDLLITVT